MGHKSTTILTDHLGRINSRSGTSVAWYYYFFLTLGRYDPDGILKITDNTKMDTINQPVQSKAGKLS